MNNPISPYVDVYGPEKLVQMAQGPVWLFQLAPGVRGRAGGKTGVGPPAGGVRSSMDDAMAKRPKKRRKRHRYGSSLVSGEEQVRRPFSHAGTRAQLNWHLGWKSSSQISASSSVGALLSLNALNLTV